MNSNLLSVLVAVAQIFSALITCAGLVFTFYQFNKNMKKDHSKELREYCIDLNENVLFPLRSIENDDIYYTCRDNGKFSKTYKPTKADIDKTINKLFFDLDAFCAHVKSIYDENDEYLINEIEKLCGPYIRYVSEKIIIFCYCIRRDLNNPHSLLNHVDIIFKIIDKEKNGYFPLEKYRRALLKNDYIDSNEKLDIIKDNVDVILQSINDINELLIHNFTTDYNSKINYSAILTSLLQKTSVLKGEYLLPFNECKNDGTENQFITMIKKEFYGEEKLKIWKDRIKILDEFYNNNIANGKIYDYCKGESDKDKYNKICDNIYDILPYDIM